MHIVCTDLEGILVPEIWIAFSEETGIPELSITTRDEPDYNKLMKYRLDILRSRGLGIEAIQETISRIDPLPGAKEYLDELRSFAQVAVLSDTFTQFAMPLMKKLGYPVLLCNELVIGEDGMIEDIAMRIDHSKYSTVKGFQMMGYNTIAIGDSFNDLEMLKASNPGILFRSPDSIKADNPDLPSCETYEELMGMIKAAMV